MRTIKIRNKYLSQNLKCVRKACNLSQQEVADYLGIDRTSYAYYEIGKSEPSYIALEQLLDYFNNLEGMKVTFNDVLASDLTSQRCLREKRIHHNPDIKNCYIDQGDLVQIKLKDNVKDKNKIYIGEIIDIGLRIQNGTKHDGIHPCITIGILPKNENGYNDLAMFWVDDISLLKVLRLGQD